MKLIINVFCIVCTFFYFNAAFSSTKSVTFEFNIKVLQNTCQFTVTGTSNGEVDFGNINVQSIKTHNIEPIPFTLKLSNCSSDNFHGSYVKMTPKNALDNVTFIDDSSKQFGVRLAEKDNLKNSNNESDFIQKEERLWVNINDNQLEKKLYAYLMCSTDSCEPQTGDFTTTLTFFFLID